MPLRERKEIQKMPWSEEGYVGEAVYMVYILWSECYTPVFDSYSQNGIAESQLYQGFRRFFILLWSMVIFFFLYFFLDGLHRTLCNKLIIRPESACIVTRRSLSDTDDGIFFVKFLVYNDMLNSGRHAPNWACDGLSRLFSITWKGTNRVIEKGHDIKS